MMTTSNTNVNPTTVQTVTMVTSTQNSTVTVVTSLMPTLTSHLDNSKMATIQSAISSVSSSSLETANIPMPSISATPATVSMTMAYLDYSSSSLSTQSTTNIGNNSSANMSKSTMASSMNVSVTSSKSPGISLWVNHTSSLSSSSSDVNGSSTAPTVTVVMTTPAVAMPTSTINLNITEVSHTLSDGLSILVSPTSVSKNVDVTTRLITNITSASSTSVPSITSTPISPSPLLTSPTPPQTTSDITSSVESSSHKKNVLLTTSSLGICYVVYTTRVMLSSIVPTPSSVTALNQTTAYRVSSKSAMNTSYVMVSSIAPSKSHPILEINSTLRQTATSRVIVTTSIFNISVTTTLTSVQQSSSSVAPTLTPVLNFTQTSSHVFKSITVNSSSLSAIATSVPSVVSMVTTNSTRYPSSTSSSLIGGIMSSAVINSSSAVSSHPSTSLINVTVSQTSSTAMSTSIAISPSMSTVVMATSSVGTTSLPPTTTPTPTTAPIPDNSTLLKTILQIPRYVDVNKDELRRNVSRGLEETYNTARRARRRKRATDGTEAKIYNITRKNSPSEDAVVLFSIARNGKTLPATEAAAVYNTIANLSSIGVWKVANRPEPLVAPTPPPQSVLVSMIFERIDKNLSVPSNKKAMEERLALYYKTRKDPTATVTATIHVVLLEKTQHVYIQFYITENGQKVSAAEVVKVFEVEHVMQLTARLQEPVIVGPYTDESLRGQQNDYIKTRISVSPSEMKDPAFHNKLGDKLAAAYITGKAKGSSRRKRRAIGSVSATIVNTTAVNGSSGYADVMFFIFDSGKVVNATYAAAIMNRLTRNEMSLITSPYAIITSPRPVIIPTATETPPVTIPPVIIPYWIIGAVLGPIFLIIIIILLIYWRWKTGAPQSKVQPAVQKTPDYLRKPRMQPMQTHDEVRYAENKPPMPSKIANISAVSDRSYENLPRRETSLRRKVTKTSMQHRPDMSRSNAAYEDSEEDEDYNDSFITMSSTPSQSRIIAAQPGPGVKKRQTLSVPGRPTPRKTPQKIPEEEDTETGSSETEAESIVTTRTDQTKFSAAQVPTVAVMGGSSSNLPQVPVRFRSSVHPVSSLPPIHNKQTSLVGPPSDDDTPRKTKRRSKAAQQELKQKADMERLRNKKRQRERKNKVTPVQSSERRAWARDELEQVLDPRPVDPFTRRKRRKPQRSKRTDSVATDEDAIELKSYKRHSTPDDTMNQVPKDEEQTEDQSGESSDDSSISMEETRKRMHTLLDDAFSLLGPLSQKQKQRPKTLDGPGDYYKRPPVPARYAGSRPALPEPAPAHGRATEPTPRQRRRLGNTGGFPHGLPQTPIGPGYPVRPPMQPPRVTSDPMVVWDPYDRQRYINQRMGFPHQGGPNPTYTYTDPQGQNVYITPVQQQRDYLGGPIWSPYTAEDTMEELYPDLAKSNYPGALGTSPPKDPGYYDVNSRDTVIDMNDQYDPRSNSLGQTPQPLIRSIKDELLRLSNGARRTPITEL